MPHPEIVGRSLHLVEVDDASGVRELEDHLDLVRALDNLKGIGQIHRPRDAREITLELRIPVDPVFSVLLLFSQRFRLVRNLTVTLHHAERPGNAGGRAEGEHRCGGHLNVRVGEHALLHHRSGMRLMSLEIPIGLVHHLPNAIEVGLAVHRTCRSRGLTRRTYHRKRDDGGYGGCGDGNHRASEAVSHVGPPNSPVSCV